MSLGRSQRPPARRGAAMLIVMIALFVSSLIIGALVQSVIRQQRQVRREVARAQAEWCAVAGLERAQLQSRSDPEYRGEQLMLPVTEELAADVRIEVVRAAAGGTAVVTVIADYPSEGPERHRARRQLQITQTIPDRGVSALEPENERP